MAEPKVNSNGGSPARRKSSTSGGDLVSVRSSNSGNAVKRVPGGQSGGGGANQSGNSPRLSWGEYHQPADNLLMRGSPNSCRNWFNGPAAHRSISQSLIR